MASTCEEGSQACCSTIDRGCYGSAFPATMSVSYIVTRITSLIWLVVFVRLLNLLAKTISALLGEHDHLRQYDMGVAASDKSVVASLIGQGAEVSSVDFTFLT